MMVAFRFQIIHYVLGTSIVGEDDMLPQKNKQVHFFHKIIASRQKEEPAGYAAV